MARPSNRPPVARRRFRLRSLLRWSDFRVPVEHPTATIAGHQLALAQLVPCLRTHAHPAAGALLILGACQAGATAGRDAIKAREQLGLNLLPQRISLCLQRCQLDADLLLPQRNAFAYFVQRRGQFFHLDARGGKCRFLRFCSFQAGKLLSIQALDLALGKPDFMLDRRGLRRRRHRIQLRTVARGFLPMSSNVALDAVAQRVFPRQCIGCFGCLTLRRSKSAFSLRHLGRQGSSSLRQPGPLQVDCLQLCKIFNVCVHPSTEVYAISRLIRKWRRGSRGKRIQKSRNGTRLKMGPAQEQRSFARRHRWLVGIAGVFFVLLVAITVAGIITARRAEPYLRMRIVQGLASHFHARVELDIFHVSLGNGLRGEWGVWAQGHGLRIWPPAEVAGVEVPNPPPTNGPPIEPLISLDTFGFHVPLRYKPDMPIYVGQIHLEGLLIHLPPKSHFLHLSPAQSSTPVQPKSSGLPISFQLGNVDCKDAVLILETSKPGKLPVEIDIARFKLSGISPNNSMHFEAELTNPRPIGTIHTKGIFGPWQVTDPGESPIAGDYRFDDADLGDFKGITGTLSSTGNYVGSLRDLNVDGQTDTPDFSLISATTWI